MLFKIAFSELSACAVNVTAHFSSNSNMYCAFFKQFFKFLYLNLSRLNIISFFNRIHRNQIDMTRKAIQKCCKLSCLIFIVIDTSYQAVFKRNAPSKKKKILFAGRQHILNMILVCNWHQFLSHCIIWCMQRKC